MFWLGLILGTVVAFAIIYVFIALRIVWDGGS